MIEQKHLGKVKQGKFTPYNLQVYENAIRGLEGCDVEVLITKRKKPRSTVQNNYYMGVVIKYAADAAGYIDKKRMHKEMKDMFLDGGSTTELTTTEMMEYISKVRMWASEFLSCYIPDPNEAEWRDQ